MKEKCFQEQNAAIIMYQIFSSIKFCHDNGIVQDEQNLFVKLIDFGSCEILTSNKLTGTYKVGFPS